MLPQPTPPLMRQKSMLLLGKLLRTKEPDIEPEGDKKKLLTTSDLCSLGVGSCVGTGMYLVSGLVIRNYAGPAALLSFVIAAISSLLSGVSYAEFGCRIPQSTGTAYHYSYASVGEFIAFIIGWNLILEYMISTAAGASAIGSAIDTIFNGALSGFSNSAMDMVMRTSKPSAVSFERPRNNKFAALSHQRESWTSPPSNMTAFERYSMLFDGSTYRPDFMAAVLCLLMTLVLISGVRKSVKFNNYLNAAIFLFIIIAALPLLSLKYWRADFYNNYNTTATNYLHNRTKQLQSSRQYPTPYRVPYQRGLVSGLETEDTHFNDRILKRPLFKRSAVLSSNNKLSKLNINKLKPKPTRKEKSENYNLRSKFLNLVHFVNQRLKRSIGFDEDGRKKTGHEHESKMAGFGDDDEEEEEPSIVTPAPKYRISSTTTTTTTEATTPMKIELPTFRTMIRFTTSTTTLEPLTEEEEPIFYTQPPIITSTSTKQTTTTEKLTTTSTTTTTTTTTTTEPPTTTTTTTELPSSSTKKIFTNDEEDEEEETTEPNLTTTTESSYEEEEETPSPTKQPEETSEEFIPPIVNGVMPRSTTESSTVIRSTTQKSKNKSTKIKGKSKGKSKSKPKPAKPEKPKLIENAWMPYGWSGVFRGAATCFYGYIGFDIISSTGGQTEQPTRSIPIAMVSATLITLSVYIVTTLLVSLTTPTNLVSSSTALVNIFDYHQMDFVKGIAACGAISSLTVAMFGSMFPMPRVVAAMAQDGMLPRKLAEINYYTGTTVFSTLLLGTITSCIALIFPLQVLVEIMSIGTVMAYTLISICILMLRYQPTRDNANDQVPTSNKNSLINCLPEQYRNEMVPEGERYYQQMMVNNNSKAATDLNPFITPDQRAKKAKNKRNLRKFKSFNSSEDSEDYDLNRNNGNLVGQQQHRLQREQSKDEDEEEDDEHLVDNDTNNYNYGSVPYQYGGSSAKRAPLKFAFLEKLIVYWFPYGWKLPGPATEETSFYVMKLLALYCVLVCLVDAILAFGNLTIDKHLLCFILLILIVSLIFTLFAIARQPQTKLNLKFKAPGLPYVPAFAILINIYLIFRLSYLTLIRFLVWIVLGLLIYFLYSIRNSSLEQLYCNVSGNDTYTQPALYNSTEPYQQSPFDNYQTASEEEAKQDNDQIELKSRQKYIDSSTLSILTTTDSNPFLQTDAFDTPEQFSKYANNLNLSSIEEDSVTEDVAEEEEYDVRKNPFLMDY